MSPHYNLSPVVKKWQLAQREHTNANRFVGHSLYSDCICFANVVLWESIPSTPLNGPWRNSNTRRVSVGNRTLLRNFWVLTPKYLDQKTTYFRRLRNIMANLRANNSDEKHDIHSRETALKTTMGPFTLSQNFMNFGPLTATNRTSVFTLPPKSSFAWGRRPSRWLGMPIFLGLYWHSLLLSLKWFSLHDVIICIR